MPTPLNPLYWALCCGAYWTDYTDATTAGPLGQITECWLPSPSGELLIAILSLSTPLSALPLARAGMLFPCARATLQLAGRPARLAAASARRLSSSQRVFWLRQAALSPCAMATQHPPGCSRPAREVASGRQSALCALPKSPSHSGNTTVSLTADSDRPGPCAAATWQFASESLDSAQSHRLAS